MQAAEEEVDDRVRNGRFSSHVLHHSIRRILDRIISNGTIIFVIEIALYLFDELVATVDGIECRPQKIGKSRPIVPSRYRCRWPID
jgi:hypothetical protein